MASDTPASRSLPSASSAATARLRLKPGHVQPVWAGHPWIYAQAVAEMEGGATAGDEVIVTDPRGQFLGRGFYSPKSAIVTRILTRDPAEHLDAAFFRDRLTRALQTREALSLGPSHDTTGYRLVHAEGDSLSGLVVDRFNDALCIQFLTAGVRRREAMILDILTDLTKCVAIYDRTPERFAKTEGFEPRRGLIRGSEVADLTFKERGLKYSIPTSIGQKTGFYFDQRAVRARVEALAKGRRVLDTYAFVGAFSMAAARGGATEVISVDESPLASEIGVTCARMNGLDQTIRFQRDDAKRVLQESHGKFDLVIVDPPRLSPSRRDRENALLHYSRLANLGARATAPSGILVFCSCSAAIDAQTLARALATGAAKANRTAVILERHFQGQDHPVPAAFDDGLYLKVFIARMDVRSAKHVVNDDAPPSMIPPSL